MSTAVATTKGALILFETYTNEKDYNILRPTETVMMASSPYTTVYANVIKFDDSADTYPVDGGKLALTKTAHDKIASAAGISFLSVTRQDDRSNPDFAEVSVLAAMKRPDGTIIYATGTKSVDVDAMIERMGDNSDKVKNRKMLRQFKVERAESGAKNRAIRALMTLKGSYTRDELKKPFVVPQITTNYDLIMKDPELRRLAGAQALGAQSLLYPSQTPPFSPQLPPPEEPHAAALPSGSSSPEAEHAALPAAEPVLNDTLPDLPGDEPKIDLDKELRDLFVERAHDRSDTVLAQMLAADDARKQGYIDWLGNFPRKTANAPAATTAPTNGQGSVGWEHSEAQAKRLYAIAKKAGYNYDAVHELIARLFGGIASTKDLTREQYDSLCGDEKKGIDSWLLANPAGGAA